MLHTLLIIIISLHFALSVSVLYTGIVLILLFEYQSIGQYLVHFKTINIRYNLAF